MPAWCAAWSCRVRSQLCYCGVSNRAAFPPNHDPTVPPPPSLGQGRSASGNHCFAQTIKKSGHLCLTLDIRVVCACGAASLVVAEDHVYGGPRVSIFGRRHPSLLPPPQPVNGTHRAPHTLICSSDPSPGSLIFSRSAINCTDALSGPLSVVVPAAYGWVGTVVVTTVSERRYGFGRRMRGHQNLPRRRAVCR